MPANLFSTRLLAAALSVLLLTAGCGRDEPVATPTPEPTESPEPTSVEVFFSNDRLGDPCGEVFPVERDVEADDPVLGAAQALLAGPTAEERAEGFGGWFSEETAGLLRSARVDDGTATVDFGDLAAVIPNASTACGSAALLAELDTTLLQFPDVEDTVYSMQGDVDAFYEWLQLSGPGQAGAGPGSGDPEPESPLLEDGRHATYLHGLDTQQRTVTVDVIQFLTGQEAIDAYQQDHPEDPEGPPNDYYIVNVNPRLRTLPVDEAVTVRVLQSGADLGPGTWEELAGHLAASQPDDGRLSPNPFWITVAGGHVTLVEEQYIP